MDAPAPIIIDAKQQPMDAPPIQVVPFCDSTDTQLVGCYRFENNLTDESSYHNNGTATETYANGKAGKAVVIGNDERHRHRRQRIVRRRGSDDRSVDLAVDDPDRHEPRRHPRLRRPVRVLSASER